jgi:hypothetical protein
LIIQFGGLCWTSKNAGRKRSSAFRTDNECDALCRAENESVAWDDRKCARGTQRDRPQESELNLSFGPRCGSRGCRRLGSMNDDRSRHHRAGPRGPDRYRMVFGRWLRETPCQYRFRRRLPWPRFGNGRRLRRCRLKPSSRHEPSRRRRLAVSSVDRGHRGQAAHHRCHSAD